MIVVHRTVPTKKGRLHDVAALLLEAKQEGPAPRGFHDLRVYRPVIGPYEVITFDLEFETLEDYQRWRVESTRSPEMATFMERWNEVTERGGGEEVWELVE
jgi:heme-degrading monooxygenase HmoA